jgi:hypothetical protein
MNSKVKPNKRYTPPITRSAGSYRKWVRAKKFPKGLQKYFI